MEALYSELRRACKVRGITYDDISKRLSIGTTTVSNKINGKFPWTQEEMYALLDMLREPYRKMHLYFPPGGVYAGTADDPPPTAEDKLIDAIKSFIREAS